jgi:hypothetical protein
MQLAHMTDLHLRYHLPEDQERRPWTDSDVQSLRSGLAALSAEEIELIVFTGDLVDVPKDPNLAATDAVEADYELLKQILDASGLQYVALPGNHDGEEAMWNVLGKGPDVFDMGGFRFVRFCDHEHEHNVPRRISHERERFEHVLSDITSPPQVHLQHFVLAPSIDADYPYNYANADDLVQQIVDSGRVRLCLSGHYHPGTEPLTEGETTFITAPAASRPPHPWLLYDLERQPPPPSRQALLAAST